MPIDTLVTTETTFEVFDPIDVAPPGSNQQAYVETGLTPLVINQQLQSVTFVTPKANGDYVFDELEIINSVDDPILNLDYTLSTESTTGFTIILNGLPDTGNYSLKWKVRIPTTIQSDSVPVTSSPPSGGTGTVTTVSASSSTTGVTAVVTNPSSTPHIAIGLTNHTLDPQILDYTPINLSGGTALTVGKAYYDTLTAARVLTFTGTPNANLPATRLTLTVTGGPWTLTIPVSFPVGEVGSVTSRILQNGVYEASWIYENSQYVLADSFDVVNQTGDVGTGLVTLNLFNGIPTYNLGNATNVSGGLDLIGNTRGSILERTSTGWGPITPGAAGTVLRSNGPGTDPAWQSGGGGGSPGGSDTQVQFNDAGSFSGDGGFTYNKTTNILTIPAGTSATTGFNVGGTIYDYFADGASTHTDGTFDDLFTDSIPANTFAVNGDKITFEYALSNIHHTTATAQVKVLFAGTTIYDSGAINYASTDGQSALSGYIIRESSTVVRYQVRGFSINGASAWPVVKVGRITGLTLSSANILKVTGAASAANAAAADIVAITGRVDFLPHNIVGGIGTGGGGGGGGGTSTLLTGLRAYYAMEGLTDSANGQTLTNNNVVTFVAGKVNNCANFVSASSQTLSVVSNSFNQPGIDNFTLASWFKTTSTSNQGIMTKGLYNAGTPGYQIWMGTNVMWTYFVTSGHSYSPNFVSATSTNGAWHLLVTTFDRAGNLTVYLDNVQGVQTSIAAASGESADYWVGLSFGDGFNGTIDEAGIWNRVLNGTEISNLWNSGSGTTYPFTGL